MKSFVRLSLLLSFLFLLSRCTQKEKANAVAIADTLRKMHDAQPPVNKRVLFDNSKPFQIDDVTRMTDSMSSGYPDTLLCKDWVVPAKAINEIINNSENISGQQWHYHFDVLPCVIKGELKQDGHDFNFKLNAGSWLYVYSSDTVLILGDYNRKDEKYFLSAPDKE